MPARKGLRVSSTHAAEASVAATSANVVLAQLGVVQTATLSAMRMPNVGRGPIRRERPALSIPVAHSTASAARLSTFAQISAKVTV